MSPFKSEKQRAKFGALVSEGKMKKETLDRWNIETGDKKLPERVTPKKPPKPMVIKSVAQLRKIQKKMVK